MAFNVAFRLDAGRRNRAGPPDALPGHRRSADGRRGPSATSSAIELAGASAAAASTAPSPPPSWPLRTTQARLPGLQSRLAGVSNHYQSDRHVVEQKLAVHCDSVAGDRRSGRPSASLVSCCWTKARCAAAADYQPLDPGRLPTIAGHRLCPAAARLSPAGTSTRSASGSEDSSAFGGADPAGACLTTLNSAGPTCPGRDTIQLGPWWQAAPTPSGPNWSKGWRSCPNCKITLLRQSDQMAQLMQSARLRHRRCRRHDLGAGLPRPADPGGAHRRQPAVQRRGDRPLPTGRTADAGASWPSRRGSCMPCSNWSDKSDDYRQRVPSNRWMGWGWIVSPPGCCPKPISQLHT